jgi:hypothetical protein
MLGPGPASARGRLAPGIGGDLFVADWGSARPLRPAVGKGLGLRSRRQRRRGPLQDVVSRICQAAKREEVQEPICGLLRHLPPAQIQELLPLIGVRYVAAGTVLFRAADPADAL